MWPPGLRFFTISSSLCPQTPLNTMKPNRSNSQNFIILSFFFIVFLCIFASRSMYFFKSGKFASFRVSALDNSTTRSNFLVVNNATSNSSSDDELRVLIGILTLPNRYRRRHFLRLIYGTQSPKRAKVDVKFVFCKLTEEDQKVLVALEIMRYDDIIILNCKENMNNGKTYTYFSSLPKIFKATDGGPSPPYHYVMKADDDTYLRLDSLVKSLKPLPRDDLYYGYVIPCPSMDPFVHYMSGMGYLVSWDIAEWIRKSQIPSKRLKGHEDMRFGQWLRDGHRRKHRFNAKWSMYDFPKPRTSCTQELWPNTTAVHLLKTREKWIQTLNYFNATKNLKPSKLYLIP